MAQELVTISPTRWQEPQLGLSLKQDLHAAMETTNSTYLNVPSPADVAALRKAADVYRAGLIGSSRETIAGMMGVLATAFPNQRLSDEEAAAKLELYCRSLDDLPEDILKTAIDRLLKTQNWFPTIAEIRQAASPDFEPRRRGLMACMRLIMKFDREYRPPAQDKTDWTQAEIDEANASFRRLGLTTRYRLHPHKPGHVETVQLSPDEREAERQDTTTEA
jgi:hypothetical protein